MPENIPEAPERSYAGSRGEDPAPGMVRPNVNPWDTCPRCGAFTFGAPSDSICWAEVLGWSEEET